MVHPWSVWTSTNAYLMNIFTSVVAQQAMQAPALLQQRRPSVRLSVTR